MDTPESAHGHGLPDGFLARVGDAVGPKGWSVDVEDRVAFEKEAWGSARGRTPLVLRPASTGETAALLKLCHAHKVPVVPQGGNTGLCGAGVPDASGRLAVMSLKRMDRVRAVDPAGDTITVEAGCVLEAIHGEAERAGRLFPLNIGARGSCVIGGNVATNAGGLNVIRYGMTRDLVLGLEVVLADGTVWDGLRALRKDNTGYDLKQLFIGSEGTLGVVTAAALRLFPLPRERHTAWLGVASPKAALDLLALFRDRLGETVNAFELMSGFALGRILAHTGATPPMRDAAPWNVVAEVAWSFEEGLGERFEAAIAEGHERGLVLDGTLAASEAQRAGLWHLRDAVSETLRAGGHAINNDVSVPVSDIPAFIEAAAPELERAVPGVNVWVFGHVGDGNLHYSATRPDDGDDEAFYAERDAVQDAVYDVVRRFNGSISAEHGIGRLKSAQLAGRYPLDVALMRRVKAALDPDNLLNPGAVLA